MKSPPSQSQVRPELMWLVDAAMSPELPIGWLRQEPTGFANEYYYNAPSGVAQWEHPQTSFLTGVATRLLRWREGSKHDDKRGLGRRPTPAHKTSSTGSAASAESAAGSSDETASARASARQMSTESAAGKSDAGSGSP